MVVWMVEIDLISPLGGRHIMMPVDRTMMARFEVGHTAKQQPRQQ